jgi:putative ABC transport system ATP-binding protein
MQAIAVDGKFTPVPPPGSVAIIKLTQVVKDYPTPQGPFRALTDINLEIQPGEFVAVIGKSGAGKTTLVNMITGVDQVTSGEVLVGSVNLGNMNENQLAQWRGLNLGIIYQSFHLLPGLSLMDNVMLPMDFCGIYHRRESRARAMELLRQVELQDHAHKKPSEISGGQQQRVAIARALANGG